MTAGVEAGAETVVATGSARGLPTRCSEVPVQRARAHSQRGLSCQGREGGGG